MAAYASLVSLMHIMHQIKNHPSPPISLDKQQVDSLTQVVIDLQEFLEGYVSPFSHNDEPDPLEVRIVDAAYAAEDQIESYIVDSIHHAAGITHDDGDDGDDDNDDNNNYGSHDDDGDVIMQTYKVNNTHLDTGTTHHNDDEVMECNYTVDNIQLAAASTSAAVHDEDEAMDTSNMQLGPHMTNKTSALQLQIMQQQSQLQLLQPQKQNMQRKMMIGLGNVGMGNIGIRAGALTPQQAAMMKLRMSQNRSNILEDMQIMQQQQSQLLQPQQQNMQRSMGNIGNNMVGIGGARGVGGSGITTAMGSIPNIGNMSQNPMASLSNAIRAAALTLQQAAMMKLRMSQNRSNILKDMQIMQQHQQQSQSQQQNMQRSMGNIGNNMVGIGGARGVGGSRITAPMGSIPNIGNMGQNPMASLSNAIRAAALTLQQAAMMKLRMSQNRSNILKDMQIMQQHQQQSQLLQPQQQNMQRSMGNIGNNMVGIGGARGVGGSGITAPMGSIPNIGNMGQNPMASLSNAIRAGALTPQQAAMMKLRMSQNRLNILGNPQSSIGGIHGARQMQPGSGLSMLGPTAMGPPKIPGMNLYMNPQQQHHHQLQQHQQQQLHLQQQQQQIQLQQQLQQILYIKFYHGLQKVIEAMDLIKKEVMGLVKEKGRLEAELPRNVSVDAAIFKSSSTESKSAMVGFEDELHQLKERLIGIDFSCKIIPIVGMGGIGKTTLARNAFQSKLVNEHFDVCLWATISQDHNIVHTLRQVMYEVRGVLSSKSVNELGEELYKHLFGRRYLVVMDDMWSEEVWYKMKFFFPENNNGSRVIVTTRLSNLAVHLTDSNNLLDMKFLDKVSSWDLFSKTVFGEGCFRVELERIGKQIVENCKGLPLTLVVIGGLAKSQQTQEYWEYIEKNLSSIVISESDGYCLRVLRLSYNHLPVYLKPCFLYMGVFEEDQRIVVSKLIKLWVSDGFLKPKNGKSLETVAKEYVKELVERNLIMVDELGSLGKIKYCKIHDLLRELSLNEARKQRFCYVFKQNNSPRDMSSQRCFVIPITTPEEEVIAASKSMSGVRSFISYRRVEHLPDFKLLRTLKTYEGLGRWPPFSYDALNDVFGLVNSRYISIRTNTMSQVPSSISLLWNLHTLVVFSGKELTAPKEIWQMHRLKHVMFECESVRLPNPPGSEDGNDIVVLENLQTLKGVKNLALSEEVARRIPNIKKLKINYQAKVIERVNCLSYLCYLSKLESLECFPYGRDKYLDEMSFPRSLKKLKIWASNDIELGEILAKIGSLPLLHTLYFGGGFFRTREWETVEGEFPSLRSLTLSPASDLEKWTMPEDSSSCFPLLEHLCLYGFKRLEEIPPKVGEIPTLKSIVLFGCSETAVLSAKRIAEELEDLHGEGQGLYVKVECRTKEEVQALQHLATPNFHVYEG